MKYFIKLNDFQLFLEEKESLKGLLELTDEGIMTEYENYYKDLSALEIKPNFEDPSNGEFYDELVHRGLMLRVNDLIDSHDNEDIEYI